LTSYQCLFWGGEIRSVRLSDLFYKEYKELPNTAGPELVQMAGIILSELRRTRHDSLGLIISLNGIGRGISC